jgi:hypothetical protein
MKRLLKEPLVHFLVLGAALFVVFGLWGKNTGDAPRKIVITRAQIDSLATGFERTWQRPPTGVELEGLIQDRVREEVYCREATALGLDKDDTIIRRRLRQKMEFVSEDVATEREPTDDDLRAYLKAHPDTFRLEPRFTFSQVYLNPERRHGSMAKDATRLLAQLNAAGAKADISQAGDPILLERRFNAAPAGEIARQFGEPFAARLGGLTLGRWQGPIESGFGVHLVLVTARTEAGVPVFEEVRDAVRREWTNAHRLEANEAFYRSLLARYAVTIEKR